MKDPKTNLVFDDYTENDKNFEGATHWTQLCEEHAVHGDLTLEEMPNEGPLCGVKNCKNEALYYYDFNGKEETNE